MDPFVTNNVNKKNPAEFCGAVFIAPYFSGKRAAYSRPKF